MIEWISRLGTLLAAGTPAVRMVVAGVRGSAPREPGASLLYWCDDAGRVCSYGSVGGGRLEARAMEIARYLLGPAPGLGASCGSVPTLSQGSPRRRMERFTLGASLGQCCGGIVELFWERFDHLSQVAALLPYAASAAGRAPETLRYCVIDASDREWFVTGGQAQGENLPEGVFSGNAGVVRSGSTSYFVERLRDEDRALWLYGAGHVGRALVHVLADLPFCIHWVDSRPEMLAQGMAALPAARRDRVCATAEEPDAACTRAPEFAWHLVMTHCHDQDLQVCEALLASGRFDFLGVIGSQTKAARFRHRFQAKGYAPEVVARMVCPIGVEGIADKQPAAIAVAVAAQLLQLRSLADTAHGRSAPQTTHGAQAGAVGRD